MTYKEAEKISVGDQVILKKEVETLTVTGIRKYEAYIVFESDGGEFIHKDIDVSFPVGGK